MIIFGKDNSTYVNKIELPWEKANIIRSQILEEEKNLDLPDSDKFSEVLLYLDTAVNKVEEENVGDKGIIDSISVNKQVRLYFPDPDVKKAVLENPFGKSFIVSVEVQTIHDKPACYKILELHEIIDRDF